MNTSRGNKKLVVLGIYRSRGQLEQGINNLKVNGFEASDISVLFPSGDQTKEFAHEKGTKAPEGATSGAVAGATIGGTLGWLAGIGTLAIPGVGPFIAAGPIMAALAGAGVGSVVGGLTGALVGMGIPEYEAKRYEGRVKEGGMLISIHCDDNEARDRAETILKNTNAQDISCTTESSSPGPESEEPKAAHF